MENFDINQIEFYKVCKYCNKNLERSKFTTSNNILKKLKDNCMKCRNNIHYKKYRENHKEEISKYFKIYYEQNKKPKSSKPRTNKSKKL